MCMPFKGRSCRFLHLYMLLRIGAGAKDHLSGVNKGLRHPGWKEPRPLRAMKLPFSYRPLTLKLYKRERCMFHLL